MAYLELSDVKAHLGLVGTQDDVYLTTLIGVGQRIIETHCGRRFEAVTETRAFGRESLRGQRLWLETDVLSVSAIRIDDAAVDLPTTHYRLWPRMLMPHCAIEFTTPVAVADVIRVTGDWGYSLTAAPDIQQAVRELVADLYHTEDRQSAGLGKGALAYSYTRSLPPRVLALLEPYKRKGL